MTKDEVIKYLVDILIYPDEFKIYGNYQDFYKDNKKYFEYDSKTDVLWYTFNVWILFEKEYGFKSNQVDLVNSILKNMLKKHFNMESTQIT